MFICRLSDSVANYLSVLFIDEEHSSLKTGCRNESFEASIFLGAFRTKTKVQTTG